MEANGICDWNVNDIMHRDARVVLHMYIPTSYTPFIIEQARAKERRPIPHFRTAVVVCRAQIFFCTSDGIPRADYKCVFAN